MLFEAVINGKLTSVLYMRSVPARQQVLGVVGYYFNTPSTAMRPTQ